MELLQCNRIEVSMLLLLPRPSSVLQWNFASPDTRSGKSLPANTLFLNIDIKLSKKKIYIGIFCWRLTCSNFYLVWNISAHGIIPKEHEAIMFAPEYNFFCQNLGHPSSHFCARVSICQSNWRGRLSMTSGWILHQLSDHRQSQPWSAKTIICLTSWTNKQLNIIREGWININEQIALLSFLVRNKRWDNITIIE
jgi:hypothetical protein